MAKIDISWTDNSGLKCGWVTEKDLSDESAAYLFSAIVRMTQPIAENFRKLDDTGKIPVEPIELTPAEVIAIGKFPMLVDPITRDKENQKSYDAWIQSKVNKDKL